VIVASKHDAMLARGRLDVTPVARPRSSMQIRKRFGRWIAIEERMVRRCDQSAKLLQRLDAAWIELVESYVGLTDTELTEPGAIEDWSVKDIIAHITTWEAEALKHLPVIIAGGTPPRYVTLGGLDAFNAQMTSQKRDLSLIDFVRNVPGDQFAAETRARRRLRLDTYSHYPLHTKAIRAWRLRVPAIVSKQDGNHAE
jgi:hypothetical protein